MAFRFRRGGVYRSLSIPGTGLYAIDYLSSDTNKQGNETDGQVDKRRGEDPLPLPKELKSFNYPAVLLVAMFVLLPFQTIISVILLFGFIYGRRQLARTIKGRARENFREGKRSLMREDYHEALAKFTEVLEQIDVIKLYPITAELSLREGEFNRAVTLYQRYLDYNSDSPDIWLNYAVSLKKIGEYDQAIKILQNLLKEAKEDQGDEDVRVISQLADCFIQQGKLDMALEILKSGPVKAK